jgi:uncharacterized protein
MLIHELSEEECFDILQRNSVGRLGYAHFNQPYIVPIHFSFDADRNCIYGFSTIGEKIERMRSNPRVCLEVDEIVDKNHWNTVLVVGRYREIHRDPPEAEALRRAEQLFNERREWWLPGAGKLGSKEPEHAVIYRITIDRLTGRRAARDEREAAVLASNL